MNQVLQVHRTNLNKQTMKEDFKKSFPSYFIYLATIIIILSYFKDLTRVGFKPYWLLIRIVYLPYILIIWEVTKKLFHSKYYELPIWFATLYIASFCAYFSFFTGGLKSDYIFGVLQVCYAIALMPITAITFYFALTSSVLIYVGSNLYIFGFSNHPEQATLSTILPLLVFSIIIFIINSKIRNAKIDLQNALYLTIKQRDKVIREQTKELSLIETKAALGTLAAQVAHDIRSPVAALSMLTSKDLPITDQSKLLIRNVINRIRDIANDLVDKNRDIRKIISEEDSLIQLLPTAIILLITEKRLQNHLITFDFELTSENYSLFTKVNLIEFKRMISNLLDNSIEAIHGKGNIFVRLILAESYVQITISDNGKGIPSDILNKLGNYGVSYGKQNGSGLGLYHAKATMKGVNGDLHIKSEPSRGAEVILNFPAVSAPIWFLESLNILPNTLVVILDDDLSIHELWKERLKYFEPSIKIINFNGLEEFIEWIKCQKLEYDPIKFLFDFEFSGCEITGLKLIETFQLQNKSVLVTSHFEELSLQAHCEKLGIKMIPKDLVGYIPIRLQT